MSLKKKIITTTPTLLHYAAIRLVHLSQTHSMARSKSFELPRTPCLRYNSPIRPIGQEPLFDAVLVWLAIRLGFVQGSRQSEF